MKNVKHAMEFGFVVIMVLLTVAFSGCVSEQEVIHSTVSYQAVAARTTLEVIPENNTPLSAPRIVADSTAEIISLNCEYVLD